MYAGWACRGGAGIYGLLGTSHLCQTMSDFDSDAATARSSRILTALAAAAYALSQSGSARRLFSKAAEGGRDNLGSAALQVMHCFPLQRHQKQAAPLPRRCMVLLRPPATVKGSAGSCCIPDLVTTWQPCTTGYQEGWMELQKHDCAVQEHKVLTCPIEAALLVCSFAGCPSVSHSTRREPPVSESLARAGKGLTMTSCRPLRLPCWPPTRAGPSWQKALLVKAVEPRQGSPAPPVTH